MSFIRTNYRYPLVSLGTPPKHTTALATARRNLRISLRGLGVTKKSVSSAVARRNVRVHLRGLNYVTLGAPKHTTALATARRNLRMRTGMGDDLAVDDNGQIIGRYNPDGTITAFDSTPPPNIDLNAPNIQIPLAPLVLPPSPVTLPTYTGPGSMPGQTPAQQLAAARAAIPITSKVMSWLSQPMFAGIPNGVVAGGAGLLVLLAAMKPRR